MRVNSAFARSRPLVGQMVHATSLQYVLRQHGVTHLLMAGVTTEVCVQTTMREANDRGYECLLIEECDGRAVKGRAWRLLLVNERALPVLY